MPTYQLLLQQFPINDDRYPANDDRKAPWSVSPTTFGKTFARRENSRLFFISPFYLSQPPLRISMTMTTRIHRTKRVVVLSLFLGHAAWSFQYGSVGSSSFHGAGSSRLRSSTVARHAASSSEENSGSPAQGLVAMGSSLQSQLASAFSQLEESDQYDAILTGLCAKILDDSSMKGQDVVVALQDSIQLLEEMNSRRVVAGSRSIMALVDAAAAAQDAKLMAKIMSLATKNRSISQYGILQREFAPLPVRRDSRVKCPDGRTRTRAERLDSLPDIPTDDRGKEVTSALAVSTVLGFCWVAGILGLDDITPLTNTFGFLIVFVGVVDNFFDLIKFGVKTLGSEKIGNIPDNLPLGLGSGQITGTVVKGINRLIQVDTERECECEASAFFAAYTLGLPCFSFRPNALEAAVMAAESSRSDNEIDPLLTSNGIMKILVWLMAPVAMESDKHPQLIQSDPREAEGFLNRLERSDLIDKNELWWLQEGPEEKQDMLKWAYTEADLLLRRQSAAVKDITERLASGAATVGDCVASIENY